MLLRFVLLACFLFAGAFAKGQQSTFKVRKSIRAQIANKDTGSVLIKDVIVAGKILVAGSDKKIKVKGFDLALVQGQTQKIYRSQSENLPPDFIHELKDHNCRGSRLHIFNVLVFVGRDSSIQLNDISLTLR